MKNLCLIITLYFCTILNSFSQTTQFIVGGLGIDYMKCITKTSDDGFISAGITSSYGDNEDIYVIKFDNFGNKQQEKILIADSSGSYETINSIIQTSMNEYLLLGTIRTDSNGEDILLIQLNADLQVLNKLRVGNELNDYGYQIIEVMIADTSDGYAIAGKTQIIISNNIETRALFLKLHPNLTIQNAQIFPDSLTTNVSCSYRSIKELYSNMGDYNGYILVGSADGDSVSNYSDMLMSVYDEQFFHQQSRLISRDSSSEIGNEIVQSSSDARSFLLVGSTAKINTNPELMIVNVSLDSSSINWCKTIGCDGTFDQHYIRCINTNDGNYVLSSSTNGFGNNSWDMYLCKFNNQGNILWDRVIGGDSTDHAFGISEFNGTNLILTGSSSTYTSEDNTNALFVILTENGYSCNYIDPEIVIDSSAYLEIYGMSSLYNLDSYEIILEQNIGYQDSIVCQNESEEFFNINPSDMYESFIETIYLINDSEINLMLKKNHENKIEYQLFDIFGNKYNNLSVLFFNKFNYQLTIKISELPLGIYFLKVNNNKLYKIINLK